MEINIRPVAFVSNSRMKPVDDNWEEIISEIVLADHIPEAALKSISLFSHLEIIYYFDKVKNSEVIFSGRPRGNPDYPVMGIFAQRKKDRPNGIGLCTVEFVEHTGRSIKVKYLDAINGSPVLDIKPVFREFLPKSDVIQPEWISRLMENYW